MKLIRFGSPDHEKPGVLLDDGRRIDVSGFGSDYDEEFFGGDGLERLAAWMKANAAMAPTVDASVRLGSTSSIVGPNDDVVIPKGSHKTDWEVELAIIIGKKAQYVSEADAMQHVAGYALHNDYSEREWQLERGGQWVKGKSCDTFAPLGPFLATADEIPDPHSLPLWLKVNGVTRQNSNTAQMIFGVPKLVSYISQFMTLLPGDVISTGTPPGVGLGLKPEPVFLKPGDVVELGIAGLGESRQVARAFAGVA